MKGTRPAFGNEKGDLLDPCFRDIPEDMNIIQPWCVYDFRKVFFMDLPFYRGKYLYLTVGNYTVM
jgi:hypothetical protein